jgi:hypothetical protein
MVGAGDCPGQSHTVLRRPVAYWVAISASLEHSANQREIEIASAPCDDAGTSSPQPCPCPLVAHEARPIALAGRARRGAAIRATDAAARCTATWSTVRGTPSAIAAASTSPLSLRAWQGARIASDIAKLPDLLHRAAK